MKKKVFFRLLLPSSIIFLFVADLAKVVFRYDAWARIATIAFVFSAFGAAFIEYYVAKSKKENGKVVNIRKGKKAEQSEGPWLQIVAIEVTIAIVITFIEGVLLEKNPLLDAIVSIISFFVFCYIYTLIYTKIISK